MSDEPKFDPLADLLTELPTKPQTSEKSTLPVSQPKKPREPRHEPRVAFDAIKLKDDILSFIQKSLSQSKTDSLNPSEQGALHALVTITTEAKTPHEQRQNLEALRTRLGAEVLNAAEYSGSSDLTKARAPLHALELLLEQEDVELARALFLLYHETYSPTSFNLSKNFDPLPTLTNINEIRKRFLKKKKDVTLMSENDEIRAQKQKAQSLLDDLLVDTAPELHSSTSTLKKEPQAIKTGNLENALRIAENFLLEKGWPELQREILFRRLEEDLDRMHDEELLQAFTRPPTPKERQELESQKDDLIVRRDTELSRYFGNDTAQPGLLTSLLITHRNLHAVQESLQMDTSPEHLSLSASDIKALAFITLEKRLSEKLASLQRRVKGISDPDTHEETLNTILDTVTKLLIRYDTEIQKIKQGYLQDPLFESSKDTSAGEKQTGLSDKNFDAALSNLKPQKEDRVPKETKEHDKKQPRTVLHKIQSGMYVLEQVLQVLGKQALETIAQAQESKRGQANLDDLLE